MRVDLPSGVNLAVWKRAAPRNRMRETFTSGSVGGLAGNSGFYLDSRRATRMLVRPLLKNGTLIDSSSRTGMLARG